jgi:hypothetical protein
MLQMMNSCTKLSPRYILQQTEINIFIAMNVWCKKTLLNATKSTVALYVIFFVYAEPCSWSRAGKTPDWEYEQVTASFIKNRQFSSYSSYQLCEPKTLKNIQPRRHIYLKRETHSRKFVKAKAYVCSISPDEGHAFRVHLRKPNFWLNCGNLHSCEHQSVRLESLGSWTLETSMCMYIYPLGVLVNYYGHSVMDRH